MATVGSTGPEFLGSFQYQENKQINKQNKIKQNNLFLCCREAQQSQDLTPREDIQGINTGYFKFQVMLSGLHGQALTVVDC